MTDEDIAAVLDDIQKNGTRMGEESVDGNIAKIKNAIESNMQVSHNDYQCDDWVAKVLSDAGISTTNIFTGNTRDKTVDDHIAAAGDRGTTVPQPGYGASVVFMNDSPKGYNSHAGLLIVNESGSVDYYDSSRNNPGQMPTHEQYNSVAAFEGAFAYRRFTYQMVR